MERMEPELETRIYTADDPEALAQSVEALRAGQLVALPTDTVYGVGCDPWQERAIERIYWAKLRPRNMAIPILVSGPEQVAQVARALPPLFVPLVERFWPGGLTVIVPRQFSLPEILCAGGDTVAVRMPNHPFALRLIAEMGGAMAVTSANLSGRPSPRTAQEVLADLRGRVAVVVDGGACPGGVASTIVDLVSEPPRLLRQGEIDAETLRRFLPDLVLPQ